MKNVFFLFLLLGLGTRGLPAQDSATQPGDGSTVDALMVALYEVISGEAGAARDWDRFINLFLPEGRLIATYDKPDGTWGYQISTPEEFATDAAPFFEENGFFEYEINRETQTYGRLVHVFSTYASKHSLDDPEPFNSGINSIQLYHDGQRWWILNIYWAHATDSHPIPKEFLPD